MFFPRPAVGNVHPRCSEATWDGPSPCGHYRGINLGGHPDLRALWWLVTEQGRINTRHPAAISTALGHRSAIASSANQDLVPSGRSSLFPSSPSDDQDDKYRYL
ncbi:hypothetical protein MHYP_G00294730 [Metynnis hypsauchen]